MQEWAEDYYVEEYDSGCCLKCSDSYEGCLCFDCKCTKCYWYITPEEWNGENGKCGKVDVLKKERFGVTPFPRDLKKTNINTQDLIITPKRWLKEKIKEENDDDNLCK